MYVENDVQTIRCSSRIQLGQTASWWLKQNKSVRSFLHLHIPIMTITQLRKDWSTTEYAQMGDVCKRKIEILFITSPSASTLPPHPFLTLLSLWCTTLVNSTIGSKRKRYFVFFIHSVFIALNRTLIICCKCEHLTWINGNQSLLFVPFA